MLRIVLPAMLLLAAAPAVAQSDFRACLSGLRGSVTAKGVSTATFDAATRGLEPDMKVVEFLNDQPEFKTPIWDYLAALVDEERVADGKAMLRQWSSALAAAEQRFGVDRYTIVAVWGVESDFGKAIGKRPLVQSLATLSCYGRRQAYFRTEFAATMTILERGDVDPGHLTGSWAGAFGHTQFMPSTFLRLAVDNDGDGRRDVVDSVPDALGSTANYLARSGWTKGGTWGFEVRLPPGFNASLVGRGKKRGFDQWAKLGVRRADGRAMPEGGAAGLIAPAGLSGPAFLVTRNFDAIYAYNAAESYALAIAHLSDRLRGGGPFVTPWPTNDRGLSRAERRELQALLLRKGYDIGAPDGAIGTKTRQAIADVQRQLGAEQDGRASLSVLTALRGGR
ncbi:lytic murein transglycosylase [Alsobacter sp. SYSU M60028]|uniref:Lytic murein transglycosylase n=1 Tax=Alsobacter ponti TaxID=2962936 RepID=A0ABT1LC78_9HYPH|nr:lytic murein transglycosylase [Alsobacter ponti]MCP8938681.1 lytic murein transglycosylase [Alsobacter ponti]